METSHRTQNASRFNPGSRNGDLRVLIVEDNPPDAELCIHQLKSAGFDLTADVVETLLDFSERLGNQTYDVILADYRLRGWSGMDALEQVLHLGKDIPFIVITGALGDEVAAQCIKAGASDYILNDRLGRLPLAIFQLLEERALRQASKIAQQTMGRQAVELQTARERRFEMRSDFLSHVSHELRTPLTAATMHLEYTLDGLAGQLNDEQHVWLGKALSNLNELLLMIDELLAVTRLSTVYHEFAPCSTSLADSVTQVCDLLKETADLKNIELTVDVPGSLPCVYADPKYIIQIMTVLVWNAVKLTADNGVVTVRGTVFDEDAAFARVSVTDTGCGIDPENLATIFERLYQNPNPACPSRQGLGVGLHVCEQLVARHAGRIWVESKLNHGSTFFFTLPLADSGNPLRVV